MLKPTTTGVQEVTDKANRLPDVECTEVLIELPNILKDANKTVLAPDANGGYTTTGNGILFGFGNVCLHQLFITGSIRLSVSNLKEIYVRGENPPDGQYLVFSCFQEIKNETL